MPSDLIRSNNINPAHFKAVCFVVSMYGNYKMGTDIMPSWVTVAREAGVDRKTAMKVRDFLINNKILIEKRKTPANISVYWFGELSILKDQLSILKDQLSNIDGHNSINDSITNSNYKVTENKIPYHKVPSSWEDTKVLAVSAIYKKETI
jgi:hypothetical protein